ncbi:hypothetical protein FB567DRAFT_457602 [Paraphoma chrysanthemicola]|uniref:Uncharacterized protein n=1 Tax=Paraphoma chrysanthemicola TaxID=798071 RepID=A0A8K0QT84_9PLEO|nr:hypothetical protein FB567DRAFT_457602 [Paraphoma chrysanthemicola]
MGDKGAQDRLKTVEENLGFMPFAAICPAGGGDTKGFDFKMIALLVAVLCHVLGNGWKLASPLQPADRMQALHSDRQAYGGLCLRRK